MFIWYLNMNAYDIHIPTEQKCIPHNVCAICMYRHKGIFTVYINLCWLYICICICCVCIFYVYVVCMLLMCMLYVYIRLYRGKYYIFWRSRYFVVRDKSISIIERMIHRGRRLQREPPLILSGPNRA